MIVIIAESTRVAQVEEPMASTGAEDSALRPSTDEPSTVKSFPAVIISKATTVTIPEVPITTLVLREFAADLDPALSGRISEMASAPMNTVHTIIETWSESASTELDLAMNIMEELAL